MNAIPSSQSESRSAVLLTSSGKLCHHHSMICGHKNIRQFLWAPVTALRTLRLYGCLGVRCEDACSSLLASLHYHPSSVPSQALQLKVARRVIRQPPRYSRFGVPDVMNAAAEKQTHHSCSLSKWDGNFLSVQTGYQRPRCLQADSLFCWNSRLHNQTLQAICEISQSKWLSTSN